VHVEAEILTRLAGRSAHMDRHAHAQVDPGGPSRLRERALSEDRSRDCLGASGEHRGHFVAKGYKSRVRPSAGPLPATTRLASHGSGRVGVPLGADRAAADTGYAGVGHEHARPKAVGLIHRQGREFRTSGHGFLERQTVGPGTAQERLAGTRRTIQVREIVRLMTVRRWAVVAIVVLIVIILVLAETLAGWNW
jgi:hypothetical protein